MQKNYKVDKSVLNYIHARDFFPPEEAVRYASPIKNLKFEPTPYGLEIPQFNMIYPEMDMVFGALLGDYVKLDEESSGTFRLPYGGLVHFEDFDSLNEWRLAVALEDTQFCTYIHSSGAKSALDGYQFDYHNSEEWELQSLTTLKTNDAIFYRPWIFHSFSGELIHCYKLLVED
jgi:hypothetical protein